ncbi:HepT-like ribonuclease domain-containing protein [Roseicella aquatilis]|uniref:DUF86 domain-containing protein n=1 Tax=Roseicella aquatilis TaxID=2527868 RepID=A0A4R4DST5_9PROT|nr:HepT-like ribonuclease domain-containing protein [Roseicella aquatilis]TCZ63696.1 DUF86 domain-containing protein [Roseicella aquatilis]
MDFPGFTADIRTYHATIRCLEIVPEASRRLAPEIRARQAHLPWKQVAAAGNMDRHEYHLIETGMIWQAVQEALPPLLAAVEAELARDA